MNTEDSYENGADFQVDLTDVQATGLSILNHEQLYLKRASPDDEDKTGQKGLYNVSGIENKKRRSISEEITIPKNPALIDRNITGYRECMSKLKITYLEQETKHKFLDAILQDPPLYVQPSALVELDSNNTVLKEGLKEKKKELDELINLSVSKSVLIHKGYADIETKVLKMEDMNKKANNLEERHIRVHKNLARFADWEKDLLKTPFSKLQHRLIETQKQIAEKNQEIDIATHKYTSLSQKAELTSKECEIKEKEKLDAEMKAREVVRRREEAAKRGLEEKEQVGKWYRTAIPVFQYMFGIKVLKIEDDFLEDVKVLSFSSIFQLDESKHFITKDSQKVKPNIHFKLKFDPILNKLVSGIAETSENLPDLTESEISEILKLVNRGRDMEKITYFILTVKTLVQKKLNQ
ncbi:hypothetical protein NADFUDRAFT_43562 [Nadsonia fulvescens var. elongata DSM 6958]|uniref:Kinetochore protein Sos7 coiled-coil domain-containing protein n=1 Tax=Nadsonia fulvescens var. elongata DSM 6958 TaxID=857566 RepID=A0A1E3PFC8_9ASCO|nr:hypothetical protein NADFUDRAFT_43562 [Nadsonia fulvescens var. elongata DSM 6958]